MERPVTVKLGGEKSVTHEGGHMPKQTIKLVGLAEITEMAEVSRQRVHNWTRRSKDMPPPIAQLRCGPIWLENEIHDWLIKIGFTHLRNR